MLHFTEYFSVHSGEPGFVYVLLMDGTEYPKNCGTFSYTNVYYQRIILGEVLLCGRDISGCVNLKFIEEILKVEYRVDILSNIVLSFLRHTRFCHCVPTQ